MFRARGMASERMSPPPPWAADAPDRPGRSRRRLLQRQDRRDSVRAIVLLDHRPPALPASPSRRSPRRPRSLIAARRYGDRRPYPSGQPGEDAASIAVVAPTREVADGDALPLLPKARAWRDSTPAPHQHPRRCAAPARRLRRVPGASCPATRAPRRRSWTATRPSTALSPVWEGAGGTRRAMPATDLRVSRRPGRSHATRGGCSELGEQKSRAFRTILMMYSRRGARCSELRW